MMISIVPPSIHVRVCLQILLCWWLMPVTWLLYTVLINRQWPRPLQPLPPAAANWGVPPTRLNTWPIYQLWIQLLNHCSKFCAFCCCCCCCCCSRINLLSKCVSLCGAWLCLSVCFELLLCCVVSFFENLCKFCAVFNLVILCLSWAIELV